MAFKLQCSDRPLDEEILINYGFKVFSASATDAFDWAKLTLNNYQKLTKSG